jgi:hypothetical protein
VKPSFFYICLVWFFGWAFLSLKYPHQSFRVLAWGKQPTMRNLKVVKVVGYMALGFGCLLLLEKAFGLLD